MARRHEHGFTLIEVILAIVVGIIVLTFGMVTYDQIKVNAGNSKMQQKVLAVTTIVETFNARTGRYPNARVWNNYEISTLYKAQRPDDYLMSPWGGQVGSDLLNANEGIGHWYQPSTGLLANAGSAETNTMDDSGLNYSGGLQYWEVNGATASFWDKSKQQRLTYRGFTVHGVAPNNDDGWFVMGGK